MTSVHLHLDDTPKTLAVLGALLGHRGSAVAGYAPDDWGAEVDWELLAGSYPSTTEKATLHIARGCAIAEAHGGGLPPQVRSEVRGAIEALTEDHPSDG